jgi:Spy/CpxP family protein refolding chaperone
MKKSFVVLFAMLLSASFAFSQPAQKPSVAPRQPQFQPGPERPGMPNLTEEQKASMKEIHLKFMKKNQPIKNELMEVRARYHTLITAEKPVQAEINKVIDKQTALVNQMMKEKAAMEIEVRSLLTDEQLILYNNKGKVMAHRMGEKMKNGRGNFRMNDVPQGRGMRR